MQKARSMRFGKWLRKVIVSYAVFIAIGLLLSLVSASRLGLSEEMFFNLRMFFMLLGPIYLTLIVKIILTFLSAIKGMTKDTAEKSRGVLFAVTALLLFVNLSNAHTVSDLTAGYLQSKGLRNLEKSKRYSVKGKQFLNIFLPVDFSLLLLELLTLLVCIVTFAPLSRTVSNVFICTIALTALLLFLVSFFLSLISGYRGDRAEHEGRRIQEKQKAAQSGALVLESDPIRRKRYLRLPKMLVLLVCQVADNALAGIQQNRSSVAQNLGAVLCAHNNRDVQRQADDGGMRIDARLRGDDAGGLLHHIQQLVGGAVDDQNVPCLKVLQRLALALGHTNAGFDVAAADAHAMQNHVADRLHL